MKTRNIIASISILLTLVMTSCSSEGDVLSEMEGQNRPAEVAAAISCSINNMQTKASSSTESKDSVAAEPKTNEDVKSVIFFLMKGDNVLACKTDTTAVIYTKKQTGLSVIAIANASDATAGALKAATTREAIMSVALGASDLESLVKIGETKIDEEKDFARTGSTLNANVVVTVSQVAARIDLSKLTVNVKAADSKEVKLTKVELVNQNANGLFNREAAGFSNGSVNTVFSTEKTLATGVAQENICSFYTFANEDQANPTTMVLNFEVDGVKTEREFTIKHSADNNIVKSGYLYRLNITVNVYGENVEPEVTFTVADWKTSQVSGSMTEVKE